MLFIRGSTVLYIGNAANDVTKLETIPATCGYQSSNHSNNYSEILERDQQPTKEKRILFNEILFPELFPYLFIFTVTNIVWVEEFWVNKHAFVVYKFHGSLVYLIDSQSWCN